MILNRVPISLSLFGRVAFKSAMMGFPFRVRPFCTCSLQNVKRPKAAIFVGLTALMSEVSILKAPKAHANGLLSAFRKR